MPDCSPAQAADDAPRQIAKTAIKRRFMSASPRTPLLHNLLKEFHAFPALTRGTHSLCESSAWSEAARGIRGPFETREQANDKPVMPDGAPQPYAQKPDSLVASVV
jgi:hypothetical protein